ncbi:MAG: diguanylate cyclase, partial [Gemmatimonadales bacterium]|nr:diguanylate cyclase [Gemmatimonadales bacterium]
GEEFAVLLPNADRNGAEVVAERVRQQVETVRFAGELSLPLTISIGVAT